jgi:hypothetical protein
MTDNWITRWTKTKQVKITLQQLYITSTLLLAWVIINFNFKFVTVVKSRIPGFANATLHWWLSGSWHFKRCLSEMWQTTYLVILCHNPEDRNPRPYQAHKHNTIIQGRKRLLNRDTETVCKLAENSWFRARMWQMEWENKYDYVLQKGRDSSVSIVTHYRLNGPRTES